MMLSMSFKPGDLVRYKNQNLKQIPKFCFVREIGGQKNIMTCALWQERIAVSPGEILLFVESLDFTKKHTMVDKFIKMKSRHLGGIEKCETEIAEWATAAGWSSLTGPDTEETSDMFTIRSMAGEEFKTTGKISGGIFLSRSGEQIWVSHYDLKFFDEVDLS